MRRPATHAFVALAATLAMSAMGGCAVSSVPDGPDSAGSSAADVSAQTAYLQSMMRFDRQALELADLALSRSGDATVRELATTAKERATKRLGAAEQALQALGGDVPTPGGPTDSSWPGLLTTRQMAAVKNATSNADRTWASAVILVDREAITLSTGITRAGVVPAVSAFATDAVSTLSEEYSTASRFVGSPANRVPLPRR